MSLASSPELPPVAPVVAQPSERALDFDGVYRDHFAFVWRAARRLGVLFAHQDDVVQEVFVVVHRKLSSFEGRSSLRTWLYGITLRVVRDHRKSKAQRREAAAIDVDALTLADEHASPARDVERTQAARILEAILEGMDDEKREVFVLCELEQLTVTEVADIANMNVNTAHARLRAARQFFNAAVQRLQARDTWRQQ